MPLANFRRNSNWDSAGSLLTRAREFNALTSETAKKSELLVRPPFGMPNYLQTNSIMPSGIDVIHPMFRVVVAGDRIGIIEGLQLPGDSPVRLVDGNFIDETMSTHKFCHIPIVLVEMEKENLSVDNLPESFGTVQFLIGEVGIDSVTGNVLRPVPSLLY